MLQELYRNQSLDGNLRSLRRAFVPLLVRAENHPESDFDDVLFWARLAAAQSRKGSTRIKGETVALKAIGEKEVFLTEFLQWRSSHAFSEREKVAMDLSESISRRDPKKQVDLMLKKARPYFKTDEMIRLTLSIHAINSWYDDANRLEKPKPQLSEVYLRLHQHFMSKA